MLMIHWLPSGGSMRRSASGRITWRMVSRRDRPSAARFAEAMYGEHRAAGDFRDIGARVYHDGHYRRGEGVDAQIAKGHRQRKVDEHNLHHNRGAANDFIKTSAMWLAIQPPKQRAKPATRPLSDRRRAEDGNPQRHFGAFQQNRNGRPDGTPVKLHNTFLLPCREQESLRQNTVSR